jgi:hypothetical protein
MWSGLLTPWKVGPGLSFDPLLSCNTQCFFLNQRTEEIEPQKLSCLLDNEDNERINGRLPAVRLNDPSDASLIQISAGIFQDIRDCQFQGRHPNQASINDSHEAIEHFVLSSMSGL